MFAVAVVVDRFVVVVVDIVVVVVVVVVGTLGRLRNTEVTAERKDEESEVLD